MFSSINPQAIAARCLPVAQGVAIEIVAETASTNTDLLARVSTLQTPVLRVAQAQTAGRGRSGRSWVALPGKSLTFSLAWPCRAGVQALAGLPLAAGVAVADALAMFGLQVRLKWPNDVMVDGKKLAGVLIESASAGSTVWAVIGIGLNLALEEADIARIGRPVARVAWLADIERELLLATLLNHLAQTMQAFEATGFTTFAARWNALHAYTNLPVSIIDQGRVLDEGAALGVDGQGRLLLQTASRTVAILAGDVSLRTTDTKVLS